MRFAGHTMALAHYPNNGGKTTVVVDLRAHQLCQARGYETLVWAEDV